MTPTKPRVGLFVTCLVDTMRPEIGFSAVELLRDAGCEVVVPSAQTCCGQPAYNSGDRRDTAELARQTIKAFEGLDYVVVPSGSCAAMIRHHYVELFDQPAEIERARSLASRTHELLSFLTDVLGVRSVPASRADRPSAPLAVTYHDSCSGLRELTVKDQPRQLLASVPGVRIKEMDDSEVCCGFGGTFCVKYPEISNRMVSDKIANIVASGADMIVAGDLGCLLNIAGKLSREGATVEVRHTAEVLAGHRGPSIGRSEDSRG